MTATETFKCHKLKTSITVGRCIRNQKEAVEFFGPDASRYESCPCDQGLEKKNATMITGSPCGAKPVIIETGEGTMGNRKEIACKNCGFVGPTKGLELCFRCYDTQNNAKKKGRDACEALRLAKIRRQEGTRIRRVASQYKKPVEVVEVGNLPGQPALSFLPAMPDKMPALQGTGEPFIVVSFSPNDNALFDGLQALARKYRRTPDQQLLWLLEHEMTHQRVLSEGDKI
jgi:hypothetical protein